MNKIRKTLVVVFSALFVLCAALFAAGCSISLDNSKAPVDAETPDTSKNAYSVSVDVNDPSLGTYTVTGANCEDGYEEGSLVTFTVQPNEDYDAKLIINGEEVELQDNSYSVAVDEDIQASVEYTYKYVVYTYVSEGNGTITLSAPANGEKYQKDDEITVTVAPDAGYALKEVLLDGAAQETTSSDEGSTFTFNITGRTYVVAKFVALHTVTLTQKGNDEDAKGTVALTADDASVKSGDTLAEGTEVTLTVTPKEDETFKVYVDKGSVVLKDGTTYTFTVEKDTEIEVVWDTYYNVSINAANATVTKYVKDQKTEATKFLDGTELTFTVEADEGFEVVSVKLDEDVVLTPVNGRYTVTVDQEINVAVEVKEIKDVKSYTVTVTKNNKNFGTAELTGAEAKDGKYAHGSVLTLTVTPNDGYALNYVTVNGDRVEMTEDAGAYTYEITVTADTKIYVNFTKTERYEVRVDFRGLSALAIEPTLNNKGKVSPNDAFLSASCYDGQEIQFELNLDDANSISSKATLYYSVDGGNRVLWEKSESGYVLPITVEKANVKYVLTCEILEELNTPSTTVAEVTEGALDPNDYVKIDVLGGNYVYTFLDEPAPELCPKDDLAYSFIGWKVTVDGAVWTEDQLATVAALADDPVAHLFRAGEKLAIPYSDSEVKVEMEAQWEEASYTLKLDVKNLPDHTKIHVAAYRPTDDESVEFVKTLRLIEENTAHSEVYEIKIYIGYYYYIEIELGYFYQLKFFDSSYENGLEFIFKGLNGGVNGSIDNQGVWTENDMFTSWLWGADNIDDVITFTVSYTEMYRVFLDGYEQSGMMVVDGESFTLSEDLVKTSKPTEEVHGEWIYHWYQEGDYSKYYNVNDKIEDVHADLHLVGEWVVPVKLTISFPTPVSKDGTAPEDMFFAVMWRGQKLTTDENQVYWSSSIQSDEPLKFYYNIPDHWMTYIYYYVSEDAEMGDASRTMAYYHGNTNNYDYNGDGSAGVPAPTCALDKYSYMKLEFTFTQRHVLSLAGDNLDQVEVNRPDMKDGYYYDGYYHGRVVEVTIKAKEGWTIKSVTADKTNLVQHEEGTDVWTVTMTDDVTLTIVVEEQPAVSFPEQGEEGPSGAPVQGTWKSPSDEGSGLVIEANSVTVNGEKVERISSEGEGGEIVYTLETPNNTYTLAWYGKAEGYILALTDTTDTTVSVFALMDAETPDTVQYFVNPKYGDEYSAPFQEGDAEKLVGEWKAEDQILTFTGEGQAQASLGENPAKYLFAVAQGHYLMVVGTAAYDMILTDNILKVNDVEFHKQYEVTVNEAGDKGECSYTLIKDGAPLELADNKATVDENSVLILTLTLADGYTATVNVNGSAVQPDSANTYKIPVSANITITITFTAPEVVKAVTGATLDSASFVLDIDTTGYTEEEIPQLKEALKLHLNGDAKEIAPTEVTFEGEGKFKATFSLSDVEAGSYTVTLTAKDENVSFNEDLSANALVDKTTYDFKKDGDAYKLTVTVKIEYTVTVNENPVGTNGYTLTKNGEAFADGKITAEETLGLQIVLPEEYVEAVVSIEGATLEGSGLSYTIKNATDNVVISIIYYGEISVEGVWEAEGDPSTGFGKLFIKENGNTIDLVVFPKDNNNMASAIRMTKQANRKYSLGGNVFSLEYVDGKIQLFGGQDYDYFTKSEESLGESFQIPESGTYSGTSEGLSVSVTFGEETKLTYKNGESEGNEDVTVELAVVGSYLVCFETVEGMTSANVVLKQGSNENELVAYTQYGVCALTKAPAPAVPEITEFSNTNIVSDNNNTSFYIVIRFKATGYADAAAAANDLRLCFVGTSEKSVEAFDKSFDGGASLYLLFFRVNVSELPFGEDNQLTLKLTSTAANKSYDHPASIVTDGGVVEFLLDVYTLVLEDSSLLLKRSTKTAPVEKKLEGFHNGGIEDHYVKFYAFFKGYTQEDKDLINGSKLIIGGMTIPLGNTIDNITTAAAYFWYDLSRAENVSVFGPTLLKVQVGDQTFEMTNVVDGLFQGSYTNNGYVFEISKVDGNILLSVSEEKTEYTVTVTETPDGVTGKYTLMKGDALLDNGTITRNDTLTLTITLPEGYTKASVSVTGATLEGENSPYTIKNATADVVITITYLKEGEEQVREIEAIGDGKTHFYGEQWFEIHISKDDSEFLQKYDTTLRGRVNNGNAIGFQVKNYDACFFQINVGTENYEKSFDLEWLDGDTVIAVTHYVCTIPESHHVTLTVEGNDGENTATLNPEAGDIKRNTQVVLTITVKEGWTVGVTVNNAVVSLTDQDNGTKTYSFKLTEDTNISVTFIDEGSIEAKTLAPLRDHTAQDIYPNDKHYFKLYLANDGLEWIKNAENGVSYVLVDDRDVVYSLAENKGYDIDGDHIKIQYTWIEHFRPKTITLHWMNVAHVEVATTEVHFSDGSDNLVKAAEGNGDARNFPDQWSFYDADGQVTSATYENGTFTVSWDNFTSIFWAIQLYYAKTDWAVGTKYTVSFNITAKQDCSIQFFEGDPFNKVIDLKQDTQVSFTSLVATLNGDYQAIRMFVCPVNNETPGRVNTGTITITDLKIEKAEYSFTDASLAEENGKVYFVLSGTYSGYGIDDLKTALEAYTYNFGPNGFYSGGYSIEGGDRVPSRTVNIKDGNFDIKFDISELPCYGYHFHFNGDWFELSEVSSIHGKTLTYDGRIYTLYNFGRNVGSGESVFYHLLGLTIWDESKPVSWDANKGLTNNYTLKQGDTITLSATIEDAANWGIVALLKLNGQDGILIAPDKINSYIGKVTGEINGNVSIGGKDYTVDAPAVSDTLAIANGATVTITIEYTDSKISVMYKIVKDGTEYTYNITVGNASEDSYVIGFAQSGGSNTNLSVSAPKAN